MMFYFLFVGLFNLENAETQTSSVSRNRDGFVLAESQTRKCGTVAPLFNTLSLYTFSFSYMLVSLLKHYFELYITDTALEVSRSLYCFTTSISDCVKNYFPRLWATGISGIFMQQP